MTNFFKITVLSLLIYSCSSNKTEEVALSEAVNTEINTRNNTRRIIAGKSSHKFTTRETKGKESSIINALLFRGDADFGKSKPRLKRCAEYFITGKDSLKFDSIYVKRYDSTVTIKDIRGDMDLGKSKPKPYAEYFITGKDSLKSDSIYVKRSDSTVTIKDIFWY